MNPFPEREVQYSAGECVSGTSEPANGKANGPYCSLLQFYIFSTEGDFVPLALLPMTLRVVNIGDGRVRTVRTKAVHLPPCCIIRAAHPFACKLNTARFARALRCAYR